MTSREVHPEVQAEGRKGSVHTSGYYKVIIVKSYHNWLSRYLYKQVMQGPKENVWTSRWKGKSRQCVPGPNPAFSFARPPCPSTTLNPLACQSDPPVSSSSKKTTVTVMLSLHQARQVQAPVRFDGDTHRSYISSESVFTRVFRTKCKLGLLSPVTRSCVKGRVPRL
jgi:hypothetical protein